MNPSAQVDAIVLTCDLTGDAASRDFRSFFRVKIMAGIVTGSSLSKEWTSKE